MVTLEGGISACALVEIWDTKKFIKNIQGNNLVMNGSRSNMNVRAIMVTSNGWQLTLSICMLWLVFLENLVGIWVARLMLLNNDTCTLHILYSTLTQHQ